MSDNHQDQYFWYVNVEARIFETRLCRFNSKRTEQLKELWGDAAPEAWDVIDFDGTPEQLAKSGDRMYPARLYNCVEDAMTEVGAQVHNEKEKLDDFHRHCYGIHNANKKPDYFD